MQINPYEGRVQFKIHASWATVHSHRRLLFCDPCGAPRIGPSSTQEKHLAWRDHRDRKSGFAATQSRIMIKDMLYYFQKYGKLSLQISFTILNLKNSSNKNQKQLSANKTEGIWTLTMHKVKTGFQTVCFNLNIASVLEDFPKSSSR